MRIPRDLSGNELIKKLKKFGYIQTRQTGSHIRLTTLLNGQHHVTIPNHSPIRIGTLSSILSEIAVHLGIDKSIILKDIL